MYILEKPDISCDFKHVNMKFDTPTYAILDPSWHYENLTSPFSRIYIPTDGTGMLMVNGERIDLEVGKIYILPAMLPFTCFCAERLEKIYTHMRVRRQDGFDAFSGINKIMILDEKGEKDALLKEFGSESL